ncbi:MAG: PAS domain S-box protein [Pseudomonadota bacterium]
MTPSTQPLAEQQHLLSLLLRTTSQGFWFIGPDAVTTDVNPAMCTLLGRPREQIVGRSVFEFFGGTDLDLVREQVARRRDGEAGTYEVGITRPDGSRVHCINNATPVRDSQGLCLGSVGLWTDVTQRRGAEAVLHTYELVTNSIGDMVAVIDENEVYRLVNDAWCRNTGFSRSDVLGRRVLDIFPAETSKERRIATADCIRQQRQRVVRAPFDAPGMRGQVFETTYHPYAEAGGTRFVVAVTRDVSEQETNREQLAASAEYLHRTLNATGDAVFATDASDQNEPVRFVNEQMLTMWGVPLDQATTLTPAEITRRSRPLWIDADAEERRVDEIVAANLPQETQLHLRDGRVLLRRCIPARVGGRYLRVWSFRDITAEQSALQRARASEAELRSLLDAFPGYIARQDTRLVYTYVNALLAARLGFSVEQMIGHSVAELMGAERHAEVRALVDRALAGERVTYERRHPGGATDQVSLAVRAAPGSEEPVIYTFGVDISDRKRAEQALADSEAELRVLLEAFPGYIAAIDQDFRYTYANARMGPLLGLPPEQMIGRHVREVVGEERFQALALEIQRARSGQPAISERHYPASATRAALDLEVNHVVGPPRRDGRWTCYVFGQDITARKRVEAALTVSRDEAERANRAKSAFLSGMSHELRTPMNAILGFGQLLVADAQPPLSVRQQHEVGEILHAARHLLDLINEMLDLGRIEAGELVVERVAIDAKGLLEDCLGLVQPLAQAHGIHLLDADPGPAGAPMLADRTRLKQVLLNLLANAIKYNRPGGDVALACRREGDAMRITVRDHGRGLSAADRERLFQPFERLGAGQTNVEGTGIGLALSRRLVEAMDGTIGVDSEVGRGSVFWVRLPLAPLSARPAAVAATVPPGTTAPAGGPRRTVLYIEDNPVNVLLMDAMLARLPGLRVLSAALPLPGLELARSERPDLILVDIQLPGIDGFEVLRRLRADARTRRIPVVAVSANAMQADIDAGLAAGFAVYLTKPIDLVQLLASVQRVLNAQAPVATNAP